MRTLALGLKLVNEWFVVALPPNVLAQVGQDKAVNRLYEKTSSWMEKRLLATTEEPFAISCLQRWVFYLMMLEQWKDKLKYARHLRSAFKPSDKDRTLMVLPPSVSFIYYLLRPLRVVRDLALGRKEEKPPEDTTTEPKTSVSSSR